jgi:signal-transduction protein with cAMP-binding, CBS, and nucleotidyltransferase domain
MGTRIDDPQSRMDNTATLAEAARRMRDGNIGCLPLGAADSFIGMLTEKDLTARTTAEALNPTTTTVLQIMTHGVAYCQDDDTIDDALSTMPQRHVHHLPVRDQSNLVIGIISLSDLALKGPQLLYPDIASVIFNQRDLQEHGIASDSRKSSNELT